MSIFKLFAGPDPEKLEQRGDARFHARQWGQARMEYLRALDKEQRRRTTVDADRVQRLEGKIAQSGEALADAHAETAAHLVESGQLDEARELLTLALEISRDDGLRHRLEDRLREIDDPGPPRQREIPVRSVPGREPEILPPQAPQPPDEETEAEIFWALLGTLPDEEQAAYRGYGAAFRTGYVALNHGDFETAAAHLATALAEHPQPGSFIALELASACLNLDRTDQARDLLEAFLAHRPRVLPAYRMLCEICWQQRDFARVEDLLASVPDDLSASLALVLLKGESLERAGNPAAARKLYRGVLEDFGWNEAVAQALAATCEASDRPQEALELYQQILQGCTGCGRRVDPQIRYRYAELCFAQGARTADLLEQYLALARESTASAGLCFDRVSRIYARQGDAHQARRFRDLSQQAAAGRLEP